jgi:peptidylprolyl isomerase
MAQVKEGDTVTVHYTGSLDDGTEFDSSRDKEPLRFTIGSGQIISGFEEALIGMAVGESKKVKIPAESAYGLPRQDMIATIEKKELPSHVSPQLGQRMEITQPDGQAFAVTIVAMTETSVTLDANHPLAGKDLNFDITLVEVM